MKKKKLLKSASLVALSAVMMCGAAVSFAGCKDSTWEITVDIFCSDNDVEANEALCNNWAKKYTEEMRDELGIPEGSEITVDFSHLNDSNQYFDTLLRELPTGKAADVIYVSPKYVKAWAEYGRVLDISEYIEPTDENVERLSDVWENSLGFYGYVKDSTQGYTPGETITYTKDGAQGAGFYTAKGEKAGLYGLPKDYSNFGLGFNEKFFSEDVKAKLTSLKASDSRNVQGAQYDTANLTFTGEGDEEVVCDKDGKPASIIGIGETRYYKPYNFYKYDSFEAAYEGGDPMARAVEFYTDGEGYAVTMPGWPGESFDITESDTDYYPTGDVDFDKTKGYITYTYAEYAALTWAITYYCNTFAWDTDTPLKGQGGATTATGTRANVYGNDQYDGVLYLLPWLAGNDANYISQDSTKVDNATAVKSGNVTTKPGTDYDTVVKKTLTGTRDAQVQYGANSENFIETYGAFLAYGSDWNGNSNNAGDTPNSKDSGWNYFVAGHVVFYGVGTWNSADLNATDRQYLRYRLMPEPVSEDYALYSKVKGANYEMQEYGSNPGKFETEEIRQNQLKRQDKWGARMDSVGYGVNADMEKNYKGTDLEWKITAAASLVQALTIDKDAQRDLTYAGAQLPNFKSQCKEFYEGKDSFEDMITPDDEEWDDMYKIATDLAEAAVDGDRTTIGEWLNGKTVGGAAVNFDPQFSSMEVRDLNSTNNSRGMAMKVLYMIAYTKADRDISLRMQTGLNAIRDSSMYTYNTEWLGKLEGRSADYLMAYITQTPLSGEYLNKTLDELVLTDPLGTVVKYGTPYVFMCQSATIAQASLDDAIRQENNAMSGN